MWTRKFWKATGERMIRGAAVAVSSAFFVGDVAFDVMNVGNWKDVGALALGGALSSLLLCLGGNVSSGNGPAFVNDERVVPGK